MPIDRSGPVPPFWQYIVETALVPQQGPPSQNVLNLQTANLRWIHVPTYQRGISWTVENVIEFLRSDSILLGNVILAQFAAPLPRAGFLTHLPVAIDRYHILVDGLQRLAVGTALLSLLHDPVLGPNPARPQDAAGFVGLSALVGSRAAVYLHNDAEFRHHPRRAIRDQYEILWKSIRTWLDDEFAAGRAAALAGDVVRTMTLKQVAIDTYFNFPGPLELMNTFLGLNTVRVDLGPVDLLRSHIVEKAQSDGWAGVDIEQVENDFTEVFVENDRPNTELLPFVKLVLGAIQKNPAHVFPTWQTALQRTEVDNFIDFTTRFRDNSGQSYFDEIRACGSLPFAVLLGHYYGRFLTTGQRPTFLQGGVAEDVELHKFLIACYRGLIGRKIGRIGDVARKALGGTYADLGEAAEEVSLSTIGQSLGTPVNLNWLQAELEASDLGKAKRVFNALLLPLRPNGFGGSFQPLSFGRRATQFHIDHLIPQSMLSEQAPGYQQGESIRNFAPLTSNQNKVAKATSCSTKLQQQNGVYDGYITSNTLTPHPYAVWLVAQAANLPAANLDDQARLVPSTNPKDIGTERVEYLAAELHDRL